MSNRSNRRQKTTSHFLPAFYPSSKSIIPPNEKRKNTFCNANSIKRRKTT